ncbi:hypothetical protein GH714_008266 [Hevea brasiliensis]|uniref:Pectinesterase catalytic domain-containing protein n=1 Tax=Hevea brasiliensis TaxID=3981 RepID=A0A6A6KCH7_HEVBR|nr:hypothetical protein GH714_008266 [Hevea brasiliensis]
MISEAGTDDGVVLEESNGINLLKIFLVTSLPEMRMAIKVAASGINLRGNDHKNQACLAVAGDGFILQDVWVQNTAGPEKHQAVALRVSADQSVINYCRIDVYQDTFYAHNYRQFYGDCSIIGTIDFTFGSAAVVLQNCQIISRKPMANQKNMVTAQGG